MAMPNMSDEQMRAALKELEQASYNHEQWAEMLYGTLICRLTPDQRDIGDDSHRMCRFGQWYYHAGLSALKDHAGFEEIGVAHQHMHECAARLLRLCVDGEAIAIRDYENFVTALKRMRLEIATVRRELEETLFNLDPLTGTPSRVGMLTKLREQQALARRNIHPSVVAMMDLDNFKAVNDNYGHSVGDKVLVSIAHYVMEHLRPYDKIFRYGGEEFLICLPDTDLQAGLAILERLRQGLEACPYQAGGDRHFCTTVSFGLTLLDPEVAVEQSIDRADKALYAAKSAGRNRCVAWTASMNGAPGNGR